ncbi:MAG: hypothetical protein LC792_21825, partial [Actinobacteria bacterium]|nr:hypothetical protein [Actinomycetota bacterium]
MLRSRTARLATLALGVVTPVIAITASPGFASGESTMAVLTAPGAGSSSQTFTWSYAFDQNGGNALSNVAVGFCSDAILADVVSASPSATIFNSGDVEGGHTGFGPGIKFGVTAATGVFSVTFGHSHAISSTGLRVQSHSGGGQTGDTPTVAAGPGPCPADEVTTTTSSSSTSTSTSTS